MLASIDQEKRWLKAILAKEVEQTILIAASTSRLYQEEVELPEERQKEVEQSVRDLSIKRHNEFRNREVQRQIKKEEEQRRVLELLQRQEEVEAYHDNLVAEHRAKVQKNAEELALANARRAQNARDQIAAKNAQRLQQTREQARQQMEDDRRTEELLEEQKRLKSLGQALRLEASFAIARIKTEIDRQRTYNRYSPERIRRFAEEALEVAEERTRELKSPKPPTRASVAAVRPWALHGTAGIGLADLPGPELSDATVAPSPAKRWYAGGQGSTSTTPTTHTAYTNASPHGVNNRANNIAGSGKLVGSSVTGSSPDTPLTPRAPTNARSEGTAGSSPMSLPMKSPRQSAKGQQPGGLNGSPPTRLQSAPGTGQQVDEKPDRTPSRGRPTNKPGPPACASVIPRHRASLGDPGTSQSASNAGGSVPAKEGRRAVAKAIGFGSCAASGRSFSPRTAKR